MFNSNCNVSNAEYGQNPSNCAVSCNSFQFSMNNSDILVMKLTFQKSLNKNNEIVIRIICITISTKCVIFFSLGYDSR